MKNLNRSSYSLFIAGALLFSLASNAAHADTRWQKKHPRREQVNGRLKNQQSRVDQGLANGKLTTQEAQKIQNQDANIRRTEQKDAAQNGGHLTKAEQRNLNRRENRVSQEIKHDESVPAVVPAPATPPQQ